MDDDLAIPKDFGPMSHKEQVAAYQVALRSVVDTFRREYSISYVEAIGMLHIQAAELTRELFDEARDDDADNE